MREVHGKQRFGLSRFTRSYTWHQFLRHFYQHGRYLPTADVSRILVRQPPESFRSLLRRYAMLSKVLSSMSSRRFSSFTQKCGNSLALSQFASCSKNPSKRSASRSLCQGNASSPLFSNFVLYLAKQVTQATKRSAPIITRPNKWQNMAPPHLSFLDCATIPWTSSIAARTAQMEGLG